MPGDLPVFLELALAVCRLQAGAHRVETLVVPDQWTPAMSELIEAAQDDWPGRLAGCRLPSLDRTILPRLGDPGRNHAAQLVQGRRRAQGSHIVLHDADLFLMDPHVHDDAYGISVRDDLDVVGVSPAWDPWFRSRHDRHLAATWDLCARVEWLRSFPPYRHFPHDARVAGEIHTFDTTFWPQLHTDPSRIAVGAGLHDRTVHFNYTISTYRAFARSQESFHDSGFRLLLIHLFVDLFGQIDHSYGLPGMEELLGGLKGASSGSRVHYLPRDQDAYRQMRADLDSVVNGPWSNEPRRVRCMELLAAFDRFFRVESTV